MKKQVCFIHGARAFSDYSAFLKWLKTTPIEDPLQERPKSWKQEMPELLGDQYALYFLSMPNKQNAKYLEWKIWFERHFNFFRDDVILVGNSQGGYFLAKYLTENTVPFAVQALYLVAAPIKPADFQGEDGGDFNFDISKLGQLAKQVDSVFIYHSEDDPVVPYSHAEDYKKALPNAQLVTFKDKGHFNVESLPELAESIRKLGT